MFCIERILCDIWKGVNWIYSRLCACYAETLSLLNMLSPFKRVVKGYLHLKQWFWILCLKNWLSVFNKSRVQQPLILCVTKYINCQRGFKLLLGGDNLNFMISSSIISVDKTIMQTHWTKSNFVDLETKCGITIAAAVAASVQYTLYSADTQRKININFQEALCTEIESNNWIEILKSHFNPSKWIQQMDFGSR